MGHSIEQGNLNNINSTNISDFTYCDISHSYSHNHSICSPDLILTTFMINLKGPHLALYVIQSLNTKMARH